MDDLERTYAAYAADPAMQRAWSATNPGNQAIRAELAAAVLQEAARHGGPPGDLLDIGCGTGWWLEHLLRRGVAPGRLFGVEALEHRAAAARARAPGATVIAGDAAALPFEDGRFALVTLFTVLSSLPSDRQRAVLAEARRVARGPVAVWEPRWPTRNQNTWLTRQALASADRTRSLTLAPPLARRVSARTYERLARLAPLRSHRLAVFAPPRRSTDGY